MEPREQQLSNNEKMKRENIDDITSSFYSIQTIQKHKLTTVGQHSIPQGSIALASMTSDGPSIDGPNATQGFDNTAVDL
jgi:hypothetical protein